MAGRFNPRIVVGEDKRGPLWESAIVVSSIALLGLTVFSSDRLSTIVPLLGVGVVLVLTHRTLLQWRSLTALIVFVIVFIPIKRYTLPASLPIKLETYRLLVFFVAVAWFTSLLIDPRVRLRRTPVDGPLVIFALAALASDAVNRGRVNSVHSEVYKSLLFFLSFFIVFYLTVSVVKRFRDVDFVTRVLVVCGGVLGCCAMIERYTGYDIFNHLQTVFPFLHLDASQLPPAALTRGGRLRVYASAQHPIALGAALAMLVPLGVYLAATTGRRRWWLAVALLTLGSLATGSRTAAVMFAVILLVFLWLRPIRVRRLWPALIPALLLIHFAAPGAIGAIREAFFPRGGLIAQEARNHVGSGRLTTLGPALSREFDPNPLLGEGFGTRVTTKLPGIPKNAPILDDQWLGILCETGIAGALALLWLFVRLTRRLLPHARDDDSRRSWYLLGTMASVLSFAVGMLFYDAFSFIQVTFLLFIVMGLGVSAYLAPEPERVAQREPLGRAPLRPPVGSPQGQMG